MVTEDSCVIIISDATLNSALWAFYESDLFHMTVTSKDIPKTIPFHLNTSYFVSFAPGLEENYPNNEMEILVSAGNVPLASIDTNGVNADIESIIKFEVLTNENIWIPAFGVDANITIAATAGVKTGNES